MKNKVLVRATLPCRLHLQRGIELMALADAPTLHHQGPSAAGLVSESRFHSIHLECIIPGLWCAAVLFFETLPGA